MGEGVRHFVPWAIASITLVFVLHRSMGAASALYIMHSLLLLIGISFVSPAALELSGPSSSIKLNKAVLSATCANSAPYTIVVEQEALRTYHTDSVVCATQTCIYTSATSRTAVRTVPSTSHATQPLPRATTRASGSVATLVPRGLSTWAHSARMSAV